MSDFLEIIKKINDNYGDDVLGNAQRTHAILLDMAYALKKERLLARHFVEAGGYEQFKKSPYGYPLVKGRVIQRLIADFSIDDQSATWIAGIFGMALALEAEASGRRLHIPDLDSPHIAESQKKPDGGLPSQAVAIGMAHTVAVLMDGTAIAHGRNQFLQCDVEDWRQIRAVAAGDSHTIGLMSDGSVVAVGRNDHDQCDVGGLENITAVYAYSDDTICIRQDGCAIARGKSGLDLSHFENIRSIAWHPEGVYGIRHDGRVMLSSSGWEEEDWALGLAGVVQIISTYVMGSLVLTKDGKVYKIGEPDSYFAHLRDITAMADLTDGFAVLRKDGMVRILPYDRATPRKSSDADSWRDITAIFGKYKRLIALNSERRLLATCTDPDWLKRNGNLDFLNGSAGPGPCPCPGPWYPVGTVSQ